VRFPESALAHRYLDGLVGVEIGGAAHNAFGLDTWNIDQLSHHDPATEPYRAEQRRQCGEVLPVDIVAPGDLLPLRTDGVDFVISSHVIEHMFDPVRALDEWGRVARRYVFIICPQRDALDSDRALPLTTLDEIRDRHEGRVAPPARSDLHHSRWTLTGFTEMCRAYGFCVVDTEDPDTKVGNGFTVVIDLAEPGSRRGSTWSRLRRLTSTGRRPR
jgi:SAM-dependent methyltransferase